MKVLNLTNKKASDIRWEPSSFPDGQQQIKIVPFKVEVGIAGYKWPITIKARLNNWRDLELICCANQSLKELGVEEVYLYVPYVCGARSDRKFSEGENNYLKAVIAPVINLQGFKSVTVLDPHSIALEACLNGFKKVSNLDLVGWAIDNMYYDRVSTTGLRYDNQFVLVSPDAGASKKIYKLAEQIGYKGDIITCSKDRDKDGKLTKCVVPLNLVGKEFMSKDYIIIDDICDGGNTFINIAKEIKGGYWGDFKGRIYLIVTHGIFSAGFSELSKYFEKIYCTNSYGEVNMVNQTIRNGFYVQQLDVFK